MSLMSPIVNTVLSESHWRNHCPKKVILKHSQHNMFVVYIPKSSYKGNFDNSKNAEPLRSGISNNVSFFVLEKKNGSPLFVWFFPYHERWIQINLRHIFHFQLQTQLFSSFLHPLTVFVKNTPVFRKLSKDQYLRLPSNQYAYLYIWIHGFFFKWFNSF